MGLSEFTIVTAVGTISIIKADHIFVEDGVLELRETDQLVAAFAAGQWIAVERKAK